MEGIFELLKLAGVCALSLGLLYLGIYLGRKKSKPAASEPQKEEPEELKAARTEYQVQNELFGAVTIERNVAAVKKEAMANLEEAARKENDALNMVLHVEGKKKGMYDCLVSKEEAKRRALQAQAESFDLEIRTAKQEAVKRRIQKENKPAPWWDRWYIWIVGACVLFVFLGKIGIFN